MWVETIVIIAGIILGLYLAESKWWKRQIEEFKVAMYQAAYAVEKERHEKWVEKMKKEKEDRIPGL